MYKLQSFLGRFKVEKEALSASISKIKNNLESEKKGYEESVRIERDADKEMKSKKFLKIEALKTLYASELTSSTSIKCSSLISHIMI